MRFGVLGPLMVPTDEGEPVRVRDGGSVPGPDPAGRIAELLRGGRVLLVLGNCEHVVAPVADAVSRILRAVPDLSVLATSQVPLDVTDEYVYAVPPLGLPEPGVDDPAVLAASGAVRLFAERARAAAAPFTLDAGTAPDVAAVCRRLDGIPLALELAATRLRHMSLADLAARLDDRFSLLGAGRRDAPARQRTLRAMIGWSWEPLSEGARPPGGTRRRLRPGHRRGDVLRHRYGPGGRGAGTGRRARGPVPGRGRRPPRRNPVPPAGVGGRLRPRTAGGGRAGPPDTDTGTARRPLRGPGRPRRRTAARPRPGPLAPAPGR